MRDSESGVNLQIHGPDAKAHFGLIEERYRDEVEARLSGLGTLEWRLLPKGKESQIRVWRKTTPSNPATWPELDAWMASVLEAMEGLFRPIVKTLDATEFQPPLVADDDPRDDPAIADA